MRALLLIAGVLGLMTAPGCSSEGGNGSCTDYAQPADFNAQSPKVSFANDVMPIFAQSCGFVSCHGSTVGDPNGVYLGSDAARAYKALVGVRSTQLSTMSFVTANDTANSYLMHKMDASTCTLDAKCTGGSCGQSMPKGDPPLPIDTRDVVRRWILQGAQDN